MYIRRKVFSVLQDESGEERYFSTTDYVYDDRMFSDKKKKSHNGIYLEDINSHRGLGRSIILGGALPGAIGGYAGKKAANKADEEGLSDREILKKAKRKGAKVGALAGGVAGAVGSVPLAAIAHHVTGGNKAVRRMAAAAVPIICGAAGAGVGALGGYLGAKKNTKTRLAKRAEIERNISQRD